MENFISYKKYIWEYLLQEQPLTSIFEINYQYSSQCNANSAPYERGKNKVRSSLKSN